jgi:methyl-accepting chemotaxis protein
MQKIFFTLFNLALTGFALAGLLAVSTVPRTSIAANLDASQLIGVVTSISGNARDIVTRKTDSLRAGLSQFLRIPTLSMQDVLASADPSRPMSAQDAAANIKQITSTMEDNAEAIEAGAAQFERVMASVRGVGYKIKDGLMRIDAALTRLLGVRQSQQILSAVDQISEALTRLAADSARYYAIWVERLTAEVERKNVPS